jgi:putative transposase
LLDADKQETGRWLNNQAENSHQPFRRRERAMIRFRRKGLFTYKIAEKMGLSRMSVHRILNQS